MSAGKHILALAVPDANAIRVPGWALSPLATECLLEVLPESPNVRELRAEAFPLCVPGESDAAGVLIRVTDGSLTWQKAYPAQSWCVQQWMLEAARGSSGQLIEKEASETERIPTFALPPVREERLSPLLKGATSYGQTGLCPVVIESRAWEDTLAAFRAGLPDEVMVIMRGSLSICPESRQVFTHVFSADRVEARAAPDAVVATAPQIADVFEQGAGSFVALAHSHPGKSPSGKVIITETDLATFRLHLRAAHMGSLIVNVAYGCDPEPIMLSWARGTPMASGLLITGGDDSDSNREPACAAACRADRVR